MIAKNEKIKFDTLYPMPPRLSYLSMYIMDSLYDSAKEMIKHIMYGANLYFLSVFAIKIPKQKNIIQTNNPPAYTIKGV